MGEHHAMLEEVNHQFSMVKTTRPLRTILVCLPLSIRFSRNRSSVKQIN